MNWNLIQSYTELSPENLFHSVLDMEKLKISAANGVEELEDSSDSDDGDSESIDQLFDNCDLLNETMVHSDDYILHITATNEADATIVTALSDHTCILHKLTQTNIERLTPLSEHQEKIIGCKFSSIENNLLVTGSSDGVIKIWDIRNPTKSSVTFVDNTNENGEMKKFNCFDISSNDRLLAAGTDLYNGDAYLLFWDIRNKNLLGGYWESHTDDVTQVKFHPDDMNTLISGSTDSLINIYNLSESCEEDALVDTLNTESSIEQLLWFEDKGKNCISCITHVADLQLWRTDDVKPYEHIRRDQLARIIKRKNDGYIYIASHQAKSTLLVLVGSNYEDGECIRGIQIEKGKVLPAVGFKENKQRVRCSWFSHYHNLLLTGGEKGLLNVWKVKKKL